jgi:nicotinamide-nucleotide amidase
MQDDVNAKELDFARIDEDLVERAIGVLKALQCHARKVVTAESCTGGLVATVLSEAPGAAEHFEGGFVVYTPEQKFFALTTAFMVESMARPSENESASMASAIALISSNTKLVPSK